MTRMLCVMAVAGRCIAGDIPDRWVEALAQVETGNRSVFGDGKKARGPHQFHRAAWTDVTKERKRLKLPVHPYASASDPAISKEYARSWLGMIAKRLANDTGRWPRAAEVFLAHNLGYEGFRSIGFQVCAAPQARYDAAIRFENLAR